MIVTVATVTDSSSFIMSSSFSISSSGTGEGRSETWKVTAMLEGMTTRQSCLIRSRVASIRKSEGTYTSLSMFLVKVTSSCPGFSVA